MWFINPRCLTFTVPVQPRHPCLYLIQSKMYWYRFEVVTDIIYSINENCKSFLVFFCVLCVTKKQISYLKDHQHPFFSGFSPPGWQQSACLLWERSAERSRYRPTCFPAQEICLLQTYPSFTCRLMVSVKELCLISNI